MTGALAALMGGRVPGVINASLPSGSNPGSSDWQLKNDGTLSTGDGAGGVLADVWVTPATAVVAAFYQVKVDVTSGAFTAGTTGSFLDLSTTRSWTKTSAGTVTFTITIREKASGIVRSTQTGRTLTVT